MSATNLEIVQDAYRIIGVIGETETPSAELGVAGLCAVNDMLADWAADGVDLGWYPQTDLANDAPLQAADVRGVKLCLAGELASRNGVELSPITAALIDSAYGKLVKRSQPFAPEANLGELPPASGPFNRGPGFWTLLLPFALLALHGNYFR
jgi:hypothetical protein